MKSLFVVVLLVFSSEALADWDEWRGPTRNGVVKGFEMPENWPGELEMVWKKKVGFEYASPVSHECYRTAAYYTVGDKTWAHPSFVDGHIIIKEDRHVSVWNF